MIYFGDYRNLVSVLPDKSVDLVVTDPPYLHNKGHTYARYNGTSAISKSKLYDFEGENA